MPRWSNLSKGSANEWKNQIYLDFSRMQPTFTALCDVKLVQNRERKKQKLFCFFIFPTFVADDRWFRMQPNFTAQSDVKLVQNFD